MPLRPPPSVEVHLTPVQLHDQLAHDVRVGLTASRKWIPATWFYDEVGCELFEEITELPEYYPTRTERAILATAAGEIAELARPRTVIELGSGTSAKTTLLLDAAAGAGSLRRFVPFDVAEPTLVDAMGRLGDRYPDLGLHGVVGDFRRHLPQLFAATDGEAPRMVVFLGGTIGNLNETERHAFFRRLAGEFGPDDTLLLGTDLVKDRARLVAAYDDAAGVTAAFNRNVLSVVNRELGGDFDPAAFDHVACFDEVHQRVEMRLRAREALHVDLVGLDLGVRFKAGEELLTEISAKFTRDRLATELDHAGLERTADWTDPAGDFLVTLARVTR